MQYSAAIKIIVFFACLIPLGRLIGAGINNQLGTNPIEFVTHSTGEWTLIFLMITLSITPMRQLSGWLWLIKLRRMIGLYTFFYASLHFITYIWLDQFFDVAAIIKDVIKRPFITVGFAAFILLIPLAITSTHAMQKKLGGKRWQKLHRLIYLIAILGVVHYWWLVKKDITEPLVYAVILACLLGYRVWMRWQK